MPVPRYRSARRTFASLLVFALATPLTASAQEWSWPERAENLQVLPADFPPERLSAVMRGFTRALGVRCTYCHVGEEGQPLSTFDFASDDNPKKDIARTMLRMLGVINDTLATIDPSGPKRVNMWCHTCHRGRPRPTTLDEELEELPPLRVDRPQAVVALGESAEVGLGPAAQRPPMSSSGSVIASMAC